MRTTSADQAAQVAALLQQAFVAIQGGVRSQLLGQNAMAEQVASLSKDSPCADKPESLVQRALKGSGKNPYCYRWYTKGHKMEDCTTKLYCEICECIEHAMERCPIYRSVQPDTKKSYCLYHAMW